MASIRQLAAIMFTDIAGYTALMGANEQKAFDLLRMNRHVQQPLIKQFNGTWIKEIGDGILASFPNATDAVLCASTIQEACKAIHGLKLHIGIHLGEVVFENKDVFGDGVNIASRLQTLAPAGAILISEAVYSNIKNKQGFEAEFFGEEALKNVSEPVKLYRIKATNSNSIAPAVTNLPQRVQWKKKPGNKRKFISLAIGIVILIAAITFFIYKKGNPAGAAANVLKSIAVLPFRNESMTKDENEFFCNGMTESVLNNLSQLKALHVIARQSVEQYRNSKTPVPEIAKALGVGFILDGSVQRINNKVKITASLIDASSNQQVWSNSFPGELDDVFALQEEIAKQIAGALQVTITPDVKSRISRIPSTNTKALDIYYEAQLDFLKYAYSLPHLDSDYYKVQQLCNQALSLDSNFAEVYVLKAKIYWFNKSDNVQKRELDPKELTDSVVVLCQKALTLDNNLADAWVLLSTYNKYIGKKDSSLAYLEKAIAVNPSHFEAHLEYGRNSDLPDEVSIHYLNKALSLDPQSILTPFIYTALAWRYLDLCDIEKARYYAEKAIQQNINTTAKRDGLWVTGHMNLILGKADAVINSATENLKYDSNFLYQAAEAYCELKNDCVKAAQLYELCWKVLPNHSNEHRYAIALWKTGRKAEAIKLMNVSLGKYKKYDSTGSLPLSNYDVAGIYAFLGNKNAAYTILKSASDDNQVWGIGFPYLIQRDPLFDNIRNETEFKDILKNVLEQKRKIREHIRMLEEKGEL